MIDSTEINKRDIESLEQRDISNAELDAFFASPEFAQMKATAQLDFQDQHGHKIVNKTKPTFNKSKARAKNKAARKARKR